MVEEKALVSYRRIGADDPWANSEEGEGTVSPGASKSGSLQALFTGIGTMLSQAVGVGTKAGGLVTSSVTGNAVPVPSRNPLHLLLLGTAATAAFVLFTKKKARSR